MTNPVINENGHQYWYKNNKLHREDGPAIIETNGTQEWWLNGTIHREDGPAILYPDGFHEWWLNGIRYDFNDYVKIRFPKDCEEKMAFLLKWNT